MDPVLKRVYPEARKLIFNYAGWRLTGKSVDFKFIDPPLDGCNGLAFRDGPNGAVVYISPDLSDDGMLRVALHELAHIRHDHGQLMDVKNAGTVVGRYRSELRMMPPSGENLAKGQAAKWLDLCEQLAPGGNSLSKLTALAKECGK